MVFTASEFATADDNSDGYISESECWTYCNMHVAELVELSECTWGPAGTEGDVELTCAGLIYDEDKC